jgi:hypothetical protein
LDIDNITHLPNFHKTESYADKVIEERRIKRSGMMSDLERNYLEGLRLRKLQEEEEKR